MQLYIYIKAKPENLTDEEKVLAWFLTMMFREAGEEQVLTLDEHDFKYMLKGFSGGRLNMEELAEEPISEMFAFANLGQRIAVKIKDEAFRKRYANRKLGVRKYRIEDEGAIRVAVYLHAALNFMPNWFTEEDYNIFAKQPYHGRFTPGSKDTFTLQERFNFENMMSNPRNAGSKKRKQE